MTGIEDIIFALTVTVGPFFFMIALVAIPFMIFVFGAFSIMGFFGYIAQKSQQSFDKSVLIAKQAHDDSQQAKKFAQEEAILRQRQQQEVQMYGARSDHELKVAENKAGYAVDLKNLDHSYDRWRIAELGRQQEAKAENDYQRKLRLAIESNDTTTVTVNNNSRPASKKKSAPKKKKSSKAKKPQKWMVFYDSVNNEHISEKDANSRIMVSEQEMDDYILVVVK